MLWLIVYFMYIFGQGYGDAPPRMGEAGVYSVCRHSGCVQFSWASAIDTKELARFTNVYRYGGSIYTISHTCPQSFLCI